MPRRKEPQPGLSRAIRKRRAELGISQKALARRAGIDPSEVHGLEAGKNNPQWGTVKRIAAGLGTSIVQLAEESEEMQRRLEPADEWLVDQEGAWLFDLDEMRRRGLQEP
jgi:transcriptional regulator with XRE-family HTH domain